MKRRQFLTVAGSALGIALAPKVVLGETFTSTSGSTKHDFAKHPYDDNKVVRVYDNKVSDFDFSENKVFWKSINVSVLATMLSRSLIELSGEKSENAAWKKILTGNKNRDVAGKKLAVKINFNNTGKDINKNLNNSPAMIVVLAKSLIYAGVSEEDILIFDCSRPFPEAFKSEVRSHGLAKVQMKGKGEELPESGKTIFLSDNKGLMRNDKPRDQYPIPQCLMDADYLINLHLVKIHETGVTGAMKNLYGISQNVSHYMHWLPKSFKETYHLPDISLNEEIKQRAKLNIAEFVFGGYSPDTIDKFENSSFFPDGKPSSLIVSRSPFYHDTVLYGFVKAEYTSADLEKLRKDYKTMGQDTWLKNSSERYEGWQYDWGRIINVNKTNYPEKDLAFRYINYVSI